MNFIDLIKKVIIAIWNFLGRVINLFLEKTFLQILVILWALSHFHTDFFKYSKFGIFINGTDNIATHDHASFKVDNNDKAEGKQKKK